MSTQAERKAAYLQVFCSAPQLNPGNSGKNYKRSYNKTKSNRSE
jgi:hypothetical protein